MWITPITDWDGVTPGRKFYNYGDLNRVENNTNELVTLINSFSMISPLSIVTSRNTSSLVFYDDMNRIEGNILALANASYVPTGWHTPYLAWVGNTKFDYVVANRLESNLLNLKYLIDQIISGLLYCGDSMTTICGKGNTTF